LHSSRDRQEISQRREREREREIESWFSAIMAQTYEMIATAEK